MSGREHRHVGADQPELVARARRAPVPVGLPRVTVLVGRRPRRHLQIQLQQRAGVRRRFLRVHQHHVMMVVVYRPDAAGHVNDNPTENGTGGLSFGGG